MSGAARRLYTFYKGSLSPALHGVGISQCIFLPSCSEYALIAVERFGWWRGSRLAAARVLRCNPLSRGGLDPVPDAPMKQPGAGV